MSWFALIAIIILLLLIFFPLPTAEMVDVQASMSFNLPDSAEMSGQNVNFVGAYGIDKVRVEAYPSLVSVPYEYCQLIGTPSCPQRDNCEGTYRGCNFNGNTFMQNFEVSGVSLTEKHVWVHKEKTHKTIYCPEDYTIYTKAQCGGGDGYLTCNLKPCHGYGGEGGSTWYATITFRNRQPTVTTTPPVGIETTTTTVGVQIPTTTVPFQEEPRTILDWIIFKIREFFLRIGIRI